MTVVYFIYENVNDEARHIKMLTINLCFVSMMDIFIGKSICQNSTMLCFSFNVVFLLYRNIMFLIKAFLDVFDKILSTLFVAELSRILVKIKIMNGCKVIPRSQVVQVDFF